MEENGVDDRFGQGQYANCLLEIKYGTGWSSPVMLWHKGADVEGSRRLKLHDRLKVAYGRVGLGKAFNTHILGKVCLNLVRPFRGSAPNIFFLNDFGASRPWPGIGPGTKPAPFNTFYPKCCSVIVCFPTPALYTRSTWDKTLFVR